MRKFLFLLNWGMFVSICQLYSQATLPDFTLKNTNGKISVLWLNQYPTQVTGISVQRSYDSLRNFTSISSVFNPQNKVNGFTDINPPYDKMYYRLFIAFDTGAYVITESKRPEVISTIDYSALIVEINGLYEENIAVHKTRLKARQATSSETKNTNKKTTQPKTNKVAGVVEQDIIDDVITYPSKRIFTDKDNNIVVKIPNIKKGIYLIKFFTEDYKPLFELKDLPDDYIIVEKVNFVHAGWYVFELFKNGLLFEENKFYIPKEDLSPK